MIKLYKYPKLSDLSPYYQIKWTPHLAKYFTEQHGLISIKVNLNGVKIVVHSSFFSAEILTKVSTFTALQLEGSYTAHVL